MTKESKVEITGFEAKHYDFLLDFVSLGRYKSFIERAMADMKIQPEDRIIDLGCGTGRNAQLMAKYLSDKGSILGLDIGDEMIAQFKEKFKQRQNIKVEKMHIDEPLPFENEFDKALISFVLHGFQPNKQEIIISNIKKVLKPGGEFFLLDWQEFNLDEKPWYFRFAFKKFECRLAQGFVKKDWKAYLRQKGFGDFEETSYFRNLIRLLRSRKFD